MKSITDYLPDLARLLTGLPERAPCPVCVGWLLTDSGPRGALCRLGTVTADDGGPDWATYECPRCGITASARATAYRLEVAARDAGREAERAMEAAWAEGDARDLAVPFDREDGESGPNWYVPPRLRAAP